MTEQEEFQQFTQGLMSSEPAPAAASSAVEQPAASTSNDPAPASEGSTPSPQAKPEAPKAEDKPPEPKPEEKKTDWTALAAKEKEKRAQKAAAKLAQVQQAKALAEAQAKAAQLDEIMKLSKEKRIAALEKLGMTLDDVNSEYIRDLDANPNRPPPEVTAVQKELAEVKALLGDLVKEKQEAKKQADAASMQAQRDAIQKNYESKASAVIKDKPDDYEILAKHPKGSEVVFHYIAAHYASTATLDDDGNVIVPGEELDVSEACKQVEAKLTEQYGWAREVKKLRGPLKIQDSTTLAGDVRQAPASPEKQPDEDKDFLNFGLRLIKQNAG